MLKVAYKYAIVCGLFLVLSVWLSHRLGGNPLGDPSHLFFDLIIFSLFVYFSNKEFKSYKNGGILHFWQGMSLGYLTIIPGSILFGLGLFGLLVIDPAILEAYKEASVLYIDSISGSLDMTPEEIENLKTETRQSSVWERVQIAFRNKIIAGLLVTPVIAIILRKRPN